MNRHCGCSFQALTQADKSKRCRGSPPRSPAIRGRPQLAYSVSHPSDGRRHPSFNLRPLTRKPANTASPVHLPTFRTRTVSISTHLVALAHIFNNLLGIPRAHFYLFAHHYTRHNDAIRTIPCLLDSPALTRHTRPSEYNFPAGHPFKTYVTHPCTYIQHRGCRI